jgi:4a-hydroxytetrahydrobiopterin dehydratase
MTQESFRQRRCVACEGMTSPMGEEEVRRHLESFPGWALDPTGKKISKSYRFSNFVDAFEFLKKVADVAELEQHHPDMHLERYRHVVIDLWTHAIGGLSENDWIVAAKIDQILDVSGR